MAGGDVPISLVISTRNRPAALARCLAAVKAGERQPSQIVIVDQGDAASASTVVDRRANGSTAIEYLTQPPLGLGAAQNMGVRAARSEWIAITDDDCLPDPSWLATIARLIRSGRYDLVTGRVLPAPPAGDRTIPVSSRRSTVAREFRGKAAPWLVGSGNNFAVRRESYLSIGGCDERLGPGSPAYGGVDMDLFYRLLRAGGRARYEPAALVLHERQAPHERLARRPMYGFGMGAALGIWLRQGDLYALPLLARWVMMRGGRVLRARDVTRRDALREETTLLASTARGMLHGLRVGPPPSSLSGG